MLFVLPSLLLLALTTSCLTEADTTTSSTTDASPCLHQPYKIHIFNRHPLIIYIEDFVSQDEARVLISLASNSYKPSEVVLKDDKDKSSQPRLSQRLSQSMYLYSDSALLVDCIRERAARFQGISSEHLEPLQVVRYATNGFFKHHYDWLSQENGTYVAGIKCNGDPFCEKGMGDRESTFFVYLHAECEGGETDFPRVEMGKNIDRELWCGFVDCKNKENGVKFRPRAGNAIFWENLEDGRGMMEVLHAGLPVAKGGKIGLNIWSRQRLEIERASEEAKFETYLDGQGKDVEVHEKVFEGHGEL